MAIKAIIKNLFRLYPWIRTHIYILINPIVFYLKGAQFGKHIRLYDRLYLSMDQDASLLIGDNCTISSGDGINPLCRNIRAKININKNASIIIGNNSGLSSPCLWANESITIGNNVKIGGDCIIIDTDAHSLDFQIRNGSILDEKGNNMDSESATSAPIVIEDDVLIGTRCIILKGVTIGSRSIIGAGSVITKSIPPDCIAGGNPCKIINKIDQIPTKLN